MKPNMQDCTVIGIDTAKSSFAIHGADAAGETSLSKDLQSRTKLLPFLGKLPRCTVALETCGGSHHWGREIGRMGHEVKLIPPVYVKAFVKRQKNDANDAAAIVEAATRPTMRSVPVKTVENPVPRDGVPCPAAAGSATDAVGQFDSGHAGGIRGGGSEGTCQRDPAARDRRGSIPGDTGTWPEPRWSRCSRR